MIPEVAAEAKVAVNALQHVVVEGHEPTCRARRRRSAAARDRPGFASALREIDGRVIESSVPGFLRAPVLGECGGRHGRVVGEL
jgi:hypothetical protein